MAKTLKFTKMQGAGNDYVYVNASNGEELDFANIAIKLSDRHFGIGSDGVIYIRRSPEHKDLYMMDLYNADGSRAKMCGNGIRCVAKYIYDHKMTDQTEVDIDTLSGVKHIVLQLDNKGEPKSATVNMGVPGIGGEKIVIADGKEYKGFCVSMGNPHCVLIENPDNVTKIGPFFEWNEAFPEGVNTEFVRIDDDENVTMRVWERGSGETLACGTGCSAVGVALMEQGLIKGKVVNVHCLGGVIRIEWQGEGSPVYMTGPCENVFEGEVII